MSAEVTGIKEIEANLSKAIAGIKGKTEEGVFLAAQFIKGEAQELTPVDEGLLRNTAFVARVPDTTEIAFTVGYTAKYAAAVHEFPMKLKGQPRADFGRTGTRSEFGPVQPVSFGGGSGKGFYWDGGENKFLEKAVVRNFSAIVNIITKHAKEFFSGS